MVTSVAFSGGIPSLKSILGSRLGRKHRNATRPEVVGGLGGFAGLFRFDAARYRQPLLATSTDGVGTKVAIAQAMDKHDTIGIDLVGMVVDDLVVCGAEPLFMTDYIACGKVVPERIAAIVSGIAEGCRQAGCALIGGETAEHPGLLGADEYDLAGAGTGVVDEDAVLGAHRVRADDVVIAMASSGLHSNGYSLARHVLLSRAALDPRRACRRTRPHARRGTARADAYLQPRLPRLDQRGRRPRLLARHRWRVGGEPRPGVAGRTSTSKSTGRRGRRRRSSA